MHSCPSPRQIVRSRPRCWLTLEKSAVSRGGMVLDPGLLRRVYEQSVKPREETLRQFGIQEIGVQIIRQIRPSQ